MRRAGAAVLGAVATALGWRLLVRRDEHPGFRVTSLRGGGARPPTVRSLPRHTCTGAVSGDGALFYDVELRPGSRPLLRNSVLLVPHLLTGPECRVLIDAAEEGYRSGLSAEPDGGDPLQRMRLCDLSKAARRIDATLRGRLLTFLEQELPQAARAIFGRSEGLAGLTPSFSDLEPAINRPSRFCRTLFQRSNALHCTAMAWILIPAECSAVS